MLLRERLKVLSQKVAQRLFAYPGEWLGYMLCLGLLSCSLATAQALEPTPPQQVGMSGERLKRLDEVLRTAITKEEIPGAVVLVAREGRVVYRKAFGHRALMPNKKPMLIDTIFDVASLTKVLVTAPSIMILVEEGKLSLTDPVSKYLPRFSQYGKHRVTILQLLTHYSGLRPTLKGNSTWSGYEEAVRLVLRERLVTSPGKKFIYSDINYMVLGEVVQRISEQSLDQFAQERIFAPLGMADTHFSPGPELMERIAPTEMRAGNMLQGTVHDPRASRMGGCAGHAGVFSTADDTAQFAQMILDGGTYRGNRVLSPLSVMQMTSPQSPPSDESLRGLGFDIGSPFGTPRGDLFPRGSFGHTGFTGTSLWIDPFTKTFVILFTSRVHPRGKGNVIALRKRVASVAAASIVDKIPSVSREQ